MLPLDATLNRAIVQITGKLFPRGFDVADYAPDTFRDLVNHVRQTGRFLVWSSASDRTIYADRSVNWAFRAWHDFNHVAGMHDFTMQGESLACERQIADMLAMFPGMPHRWSTILRLEVIGQAETGGFVADQAGFIAAALAQES